MRHPRGRVRRADRGHGRDQPRDGGDIRVAVVSGASSGIGAELVARLRGRGFHVVGLSRRPSEADEHETVDVSDRAEVDAAAARVLERHPRIDLLVNNAGIAGRTRYVDGDPDAIEAVVRVNYLGSVWVASAFLPGLERGATIVNVVSVAGSVAGGPYSASKHAQLAFSRSLAVELGPRGIHVLTVNPGFVETEGFPQHPRLGPLARRLVVDPAFVAERILGAVDKGKREIVVPRWYRPAGWAQALAPGLLARRRPRSRTARTS